MKRTAILIAACLAALPSLSIAQVPDFTLGYQWTFSGKEYALANTTLQESWLGKGINLVAVAGYETRQTIAPAFGFGLTYRLDARPVFADLGAFVLFPQKAQLDIGFGVVFGVKF